MLAGTISMSRGAFALARITATPLMPLAARWHGSAVEIVCGDAIAPGGSERTMAAEAAVWLERYLREFPGEVTKRTIESLNPSPRR